MEPRVRRKLQSKPRGGAQYRLLLGRRAGISNTGTLGYWIVPLRHLAGMPAFSWCGWASKADLEIKPRCGNPGPNRNCNLGAVCRRIAEMRRVCPNSNSNPSPPRRFRGCAYQFPLCTPAIIPCGYKLRRLALQLGPQAWPCLQKSAGHIPCWPHDIRDGFNNTSKFLLNHTGLHPVTHPTT